MKRFTGTITSATQTRIVINRGSTYVAIDYPNADAPEAEAGRIAHVKSKSNIRGAMKYSRIRVANCNDVELSIYKTKAHNYKELQNAK